MEQKQVSIKWLTQSTFAGISGSCSSINVLRRLRPASTEVECMSSGLVYCKTQMNHCCSFLNNLVCQLVTTWCVVCFQKSTSLKGYRLKWICWYIGHSIRIGVINLKYNRCQICGQVPLDDYTLYTRQQLLGGTAGLCYYIPHLYIISLGISCAHLQHSLSRPTALYNSICLGWHVLFIWKLLRNYPMFEAFC